MGACGLCIYILHVHRFNSFISKTNSERVKNKEGGFSRIAFFRINRNIHVIQYSL